MIKTKIEELKKEEENFSEIICPPDPERIVEGLRDTGYNFNTAIADIVDNSIAANATQIEMQWPMDQKSDLIKVVLENLD